MAMKVETNTAPKKQAGKTKALELATVKDVFAEIDRIKEAHKAANENALNESLNRYKQQGGQPGELIVSIEGNTTTVRIGESVVHYMANAENISSVDYPAEDTAPEAETPKA
jgi:hypothetical protein